MAFKDGPTSQENSATPFLQELVDFFGGGNATNQLGFATDLQRNVGEGIQQFIAGQGNPFDQSEQFANLQTIFEQDRVRANQGIQEQFGASGLRFGTPIAVGTARNNEGLIPRQEAILGQLAFQGHEGAQGRLADVFNSGTAAAAGIFDPFIRLAVAGREDTGQQQGITSAAADIGSIFSPIPG